MVNLNEKTKKAVTSALILALFAAFFFACIQTVAAEEITNGGFEDDFTGWTNSFASISTSEYHTGAKSALVDYSCGFSQELNVDIDLISSFTVYVKKDAGLGNTWISYDSDHGSDNFLVFGGTSDAEDWTEVDILAEMLADGAYGNLTGVGVTRMSDYVRNFWFDDFSLNAPVPTPTPSPTPDPTANPSAVDLDLYFHADVVEVNNVSGYAALETTPDEVTYANDSAAGSLTVSWGWRCYVQYATVAAELTDGSPDAVVTQTFIDGDAAELLTADLSFPATRLSFGRVALKFVLYSRWGAGSWTARAVYISALLYYSTMRASTVTFSLYAVRNESGGSTNAYAYWGNTTCLSGVSGLSFTIARTPDWQKYYLDTGNFLSFLTIPYTLVIGNGIYAIVLFGVGMSLYIRYRKMSIVAFFILLMSGSGAAGVINLLVGEIFAGVVWIAAVFGLALVLWRVFS